jgi:tol-pal system protein YbgF
VALVTATLLIVSGCAWQQDVDSLNRRVHSLERNSDKLKEQTQEGQVRYEEDKDNALSRHASLNAVLQSLRDEMALLRGDLEKTQYELQRGTADGENRQGDLSRLEKAVQNSLDRIVRIEEYLGLEPSEKLPASEADQEAPEEGEALEATPEELYRRAKELFDKGEYENARELFRSFVNQFPNSKVADNAQFWIGEIYYREKWYEKAILEYQKVIENYPNGSKTPGALLKQGFAFLNLDDKANARLILKELVRKFPDSSEADVAKNKLAALQ